MATPNTFIKLYRSVLDSAVFADADMLKLWIYILCNASYDDEDVLFDGKVVHLMRGQMVTGRKVLAKELRTADSKVYRMLLRLKELGNVNIETNNRFTLITVVKWDFFQGSVKKVNSGLNSKRTANEQQTNSKRTADEHNQRNKEIYNINNNNIYPPYSPPLKGGDDDTQPSPPNYVQKLEKVSAPLTDEAMTDEVRAFGEYGNVLMTDAEYGKLADMFPELYMDAINELDLVMEESERNYKRYAKKKHYIVIRLKLSKVIKGARAVSGTVDDNRLSFNLEDIYERP